MPGLHKAKDIRYAALKTVCDDEEYNSQHPQVIRKALRSCLRSLFYAVTGSYFLLTWIVSAYHAWQNITDKQALTENAFAFAATTDHDVVSYPGVKMIYGWDYCDGVNDPEGARKRNCIFDPTYVGWLPRPCHDEVLYREFVALRDFSWFSDENYTIPLNQTFVFSGEAGSRSYVRGIFHYRHCEYIIKSLFRNVARPGKALGHQLVDQGYLDNCLDWLMNNNTAESRQSYADTIQWSSSLPCYVRT